MFGQVAENEDDIFFIFVVGRVRDQNIFFMPAQQLDEKIGQKAV